MISEPLLTSFTGLALRVLGVVLVLLAVAHRWLPRALGWPPVARGGLDGVVVRMHSGYVALFVAVLGLVCLLAAPDLLAGSRLAGLVLAGGSLTFVLRTVAEVVWVGPVLRRSGTPRALRLLHRIALLGWPLAAVVLLLALVLTVSS